MNKPSHVLSQGDYSNNVNVVDWLKGYVPSQDSKQLEAAFPSGYS